MPTRLLKLKFPALISLYFLVLFSSIHSNASEQFSEILKLKQSAAEKNLARQLTWSRLLYFREGAKQSDLIDAGYFFHLEGNKDKQKELFASIEAYFSPWTDKPDEHPICKFPGRYFWLNKQLELPDFENLLEKKCKRIHVWGFQEKTQSVSLMLVSGYLGNPASSFGHSFLKLNLNESSIHTSLFDKSLNYGAAVPPNESIVRYVVLGITGGYRGRFTGEYFFTQDRVYSRTEFRDMWEYELKLDEEQLRFLTLHLWDITGREFQYFFFDRNCAFRIAQLVELVSDSDLSADPRPWYLPETLFQNLDMSQTNLIKEISFVPSSQRELYAQLESLNNQELEIIERIHKTKSLEDEVWGSIAELDADRQIDVLDALLAYHKYLLIASGNKQDDFMRQLEQKILITRLALPAKPRQQGSIDELISPAKGNKASVIGLAGFHNRDESGSLVNIAAYKKDFTNKNSLEGNELVLLDFTFRDSELYTALEHVDLIKASNIKPSSSYLSSERKWAWQINLGAERDVLEEDYVAYFKASMGKSFYVANNLFIYGLVGPQLNHVEPVADATLKTGFVYLHPQFTFSGFNEQYWSEDGGHYKLAEGNISYFLKKDINVFLKLRDIEITEAQAGLSFYF